MRFVATLTGAADALPDVALPLSSLRVTYQDATSASFSAVVSSLDWITAIQDRPNGQLVVDVYEGDQDTELMRGSIYSLRFDQGAASASISLSGAPSQANPPEATHILAGVSYRGWTDAGERRVRAAPLPALRAGDTVIDEGRSYLVDTVTWWAQATGNSLQIQMETSIRLTPKINVQSPQALGLVAAWPLNDGSGLVARDALGGYHGVLTNGPTLTLHHPPPPWPFGYALRFGGTKYVTLGGVPAFASGDFTFTAGVSFFSLTPYNIITIGNTDALFISTHASGQGLRAGRSNSGSVATEDCSAAYTFTLDQWYRITLVRENGVFTFYVDDLALTTTTGNGAVSYPSSGQIVGGDGGSLPGNLSLADVRIYNRALSAPEVQQIYLHPQEPFA